MRHIRRIFDLEVEEAESLIKRGLELKKRVKSGIPHRPLTGKILALIFEKPSTRTRVSFEAAMLKLGGETIFLSARDLQLARGEPLKDTARVLSRYVDGIVVRTFGQEVVDELAAYASVPIINGLSDKFHPCQVLSDLMTVVETGRRLEDLKVAWVGDGNNMANSWLEAAALFGFELRLACPEGYDPDEDVFSEARKHAKKPILLTRDPVEAVKGADVINTDVWASMGQEAEAAERRQIFQPYQVNQELLQHAAPGAIVLHCLPAHRGEEITEEVLEGPQSVVWEQSENKMWLHAAVLEYLLA
ncbi:ornithine carbamoyltransferase [Thermosulfurimonas dismutans]|uniref:Ornithine carbamoyltransferase n=1 Tax=Thermosulfurimonas dismutans TaxID=999894 RepID=A0A179D360_9BACT|nr:ornithine carbamoyltransferase [Thermosulfurimonas dismutans]OAQ20495.1 Ornithine carbamoyltransferase [Thermosulfurimonas dismutans]